MEEKQINVGINEGNLDRDIPDSVWNNYLSKYSEKYRVKPGKDNIKRIWCHSMGEISIYSLLASKLLFYRDFLTSKKKSYFIKTLPAFCQITQNAMTEVCVSFPESKLEVLEGIFKIKKRKKLSEEQKQVLRDRLKVNLNKE